MKGAKLHECLADLGFIVYPDKNSTRGHFVRWPNGSPLGFYQLTRDDIYRTGWVESPRSQGRIDCPTWTNFYDRITKAKQR